MKTKILLSFAVLGMQSCAIAPTQVGGALFSNVKEPVLINESNNGQKEGISCGENILGIYASGDMSIETAAKNGKITKIQSVNREVKNRWLWSDVCTIVRGH
jgi:hypothetical protein